MACTNYTLHTINFVLHTTQYCDVLDNTVYCIQRVRLEQCWPQDNSTKRGPREWNF